MPAPTIHYRDPSAQAACRHPPNTVSAAGPALRHPAFLRYDEAGVMA
jgi:hypothetical protein